MYPLSNIYGFLVEHLHFNSGLNGTLFHTKYSFFVEYLWIGPMLLYDLDALFLPDMLHKFLKQFITHR